MIDSLVETHEESHDSEGSKGRREERTVVIDAGIATEGRFFYSHHPEFIDKNFDFFLKHNNRSKKIK